MKSARFHQEAEAELIAAVIYYEGQCPGLGSDLREEVAGAVALIQQEPERFAARPSDGLRKCSVSRFPYTIYYQELDTEVWIAAVAHQKRRPGYWTRRTPS